MTSHILSFFFLSGLSIPDEDTESSQNGKYCLVAIGRLQVCQGNVSGTRFYCKTENV